MFVYFIQMGKRGPIKIGKANHVGQRLVALQVANPVTLRVLVAFPAESEADAIRMEAWFHDRFKRKLIRGEWFMGTIELKTIMSGYEHAKADRSWEDVCREQGGRVRAVRGDRGYQQGTQVHQDKIDKHVDNGALW